MANYFFFYLPAWNLVPVSIHPHAPETHPRMGDFISKYFPAIPPTAFAVVSVVILFHIANKIFTHFSAPIRKLPGPKSVNWFTGSNARNVWEPDSQHDQLKWVRQYGHVFRYYSWFNVTKVVTTDLQALSHILNGPEFEKSDDGRLLLGDMLGKGLLVVEGLKHKQQRRIMSPAFGLPQIRKYSQLFIEKANEFRDALTAKIPQPRTPHDSLRIDIYLWLNKITLDIIGHAGFNYVFGSLHKDEPHEVTEGFRKATTFDPFNITFMFTIGTATIPGARLIPTDRSRLLASTVQSLRSLGQSVISRKKAEILATTEAKSDIAKRSIQGRDLLTLLVRANMAKDIPENARMTDEEVLAQVSTFLLAGHETTTTAIVWAIYALGCHPTAYAKLTTEARGFYTDSPSMDELNGMTYLDYVTREVLRLHAPVSNTERVARADVVVPLSEPFIDRDGVERHDISLRKGDIILIPILAIHQMKSLWGEDADEFKPERWEAIPDAVKAIPGVFSNLLTFISGPHACIGYRFSLVEMKAILFSFVRAFDFELAVPPSEISRKTMVVARPFLASDPDSGPQLPLIIRPARID
ncbi:cytochrome P450 [Russula earlei]|uniref:Cytochrome P450 n=1 Tax=Russula earlei TaxID=71964 RepID=A0ACC0UPP2_9AGAM|nr:cytochrome P450 [Russula earlei]